MCGIYGFATKTSIPNLRQITMILAGLNTSRGGDSWGVTDGKEIWKDVGQAIRNIHRMPLPPWDDAKGLYVGHTRAATVGAKTQRNAHPFRYDMKDGTPIIGVHNGHVSNHIELKNKYERKEAEVDSEHIFMHLANEMSLREVDARGAIVYFKGDKLYLSRFNGGSLAVARIKTGGIIFSSSEEHLVVALEGAGADWVQLNVKEDNLYIFDKNNLYEVEKRLEIGRGVSTVRTFRGHGTGSHNGYAQGGTGYGGHGVYGSMGPTVGARKTEKTALEIAMDRVKIKVRIVADRQTLEKLIDEEAANLKGEEKPDHKEARLKAKKRAEALQEIAPMVTKLGQAFVWDNSSLLPCRDCKAYTTKRMKGPDAGTHLVLCLGCICVGIKDGSIKIQEPAVSASEGKEAEVPSA